MCLMVFIFLEYDAKKNVYNWSQMHKLHVYWNYLDSYYIFVKTSHWIYTYTFLYTILNAWIVLLYMILNIFYQHWNNQLKIVLNHHIQFVDSPSSLNQSLLNSKWDSNFSSLGITLLKTMYFHIWRSSLFLLALVDFLPSWGDFVLVFLFRVLKSYFICCNSCLSG